jgi:hypothetical protein
MGRARFRRDDDPANACRDAGRLPDRRPAEELPLRCRQELPQERAGARWLTQLGSPFQLLRLSELLPRQRSPQARVAEEQFEQATADEPALRLPKAPPQAFHPQARAAARLAAEQRQLFACQSLSGGEAVRPQQRGSTRPQPPLPPPALSEQHQTWAQEQPDPLQEVAKPRGRQAPPHQWCC